jgi:cobalamin-dependent methionine synthase I
MKISTDEVIRYLRMSKAAADEQVSALIKELTDTFAANAVPKSVYGIWDCTVNSKEVSDTVIIEGMTVKSGNLAKHLTGCRRAALLAATLGTEADTLLRRYSVRNMEKAVIGQAVCAAMIEAYCDEIENEIRQTPAVSGLCPTTRFSPGYGDFDIAHQKDIVRLLNSDRRIGLTLTSGYMLTPSKSVTAVIG